MAVFTARRPVSLTDTTRMWTVTLYFPCSHHMNFPRVHCCSALSSNPTENTCRAKEAFYPNLAWGTNQLTGVTYHSTLRQEVAYRGPGDDTKPISLVSPAQLAGSYAIGHRPLHQQGIATYMTSEFLASFLPSLPPSSCNKGMLQSVMISDTVVFQGVCLHDVLLSNDRSLGRLRGCYLNFHPLALPAPLIY